MDSPVPDGACYCCKEPTDSFAGNPAKWPVFLPHFDGSGLHRYYHTGCLYPLLKHTDQCKKGAQEVQDAVSFELAKSLASHLICSGVVAVGGKIDEAILNNLANTGAQEIVTLSKGGK